MWAKEEEDEDDTEYEYLHDVKCLNISLDSLSLAISYAMYTGKDGRLFDKMGALLL